MPSQLENEIKVLSDLFISKLGSKTSEIVNLWKLIESDLENKNLILELYQITHKLSGSAGSFNCHKVGNISRKIELILDQAIQENIDQVKEKKIVIKKLINELIDETHSI